MKTLVEMDGDEHQAHRLVVNKWFLPGSIRRLDAAITARAEDAIADMRRLGGSCDFRPRHRHSLPRSTSS